MRLTLIGVRDGASLFFNGEAEEVSNEMTNRCAAATRAAVLAREDFQDVSKLLSVYFGVQRAIRRI
jgi:hypothetical protein